MECRAAARLEESLKRSFTTTNGVLPGTSKVAHDELMECRAAECLEEGSKTPDQDVQWCASHKYKINVPMWFCVAARLEEGFKKSIRIMYGVLSVNFQKQCFND